MVARLQDRCWWLILRICRTVSPADFLRQYRICSEQFFIQPPHKARRVDNILRFQQAKICLAWISCHRSPFSRQGLLRLLSCYFGRDTCYRIQVPQASRPVPFRSRRFPKAIGRLFLCQDLRSIRRQWFHCFRLSSFTDSGPVGSDLRFPPGRISKGPME